jgi:class 3 adenylate cyclase
MGEIHYKTFEEPDEVITLPKLFGQVVLVGELYVGRYVHEPGWCWSKDMQPLIGTSSCQHHHQGFVLSGRMLLTTDEGAQRTFGPGGVFDIPPGHDACILGDEPLITVEFRGARDWAKPMESRERVLATLLFTDIVGSTAAAVRMGDRAWKELLEQHYDRVRMELERYRGYEIKTTGDGFLAIFDGTARAVRCGESICRAAKKDGMEVRVGVHTGEVERHIDTVHGLAVHIAARVMALAGPGEVFLSASTVALLEGSGMSFTDAGEHELKGLDGRRRLYRLVHEQFESSERTYTA